MSAKEEYDNFLKDFRLGRCYLCNKNLSVFNKDDICLHWLLNPSGVKKRYFKDIFRKFDLFQISSYLMWVSYQENGPTNINNLTLERDKNKSWETTIKYKNLKWSITCSDTDFTGHESSKVNFPHYHFSMEVNSLPFISFSNYHIPLTNEDILKLKAHNNTSGKLIHFWYILGMDELFKIEPKELLKSMKVDRDESTAPFHLSGMFEMNGGISGEDINKAIIKSKETGDSLVKCFSEIPKIKMQVIIEPGGGVPELDRKLSRSQRRRAKNENTN